MQLPAEKQEKRGLPHRLTVAFHNGLHREADRRTDVRTYVRRTDSDVITKPKFLAFTGYRILLAMGLRCTRQRHAPELRYKKNLSKLKSELYREACKALSKKSDLRLKLNCIERLGKRFIKKSNLRLKVNCIEGLGKRVIKKSDLRLKVNCIERLRERFIKKP